MKGGIHGLKISQVSLILIGLVCVTVLVLSWTKTSFLPAFIPSPNRDLQLNLDFIGGKLRKKFFRWQTTPYDRHPTALRLNNSISDNSNSWLQKMVVKSASKIISYGAELFLPSVFRRSLPPLPPLVENDTSAYEN